MQTPGTCLHHTVLLVGVTDPGNSGAWVGWGSYFVQIYMEKSTFSNAHNFVKNLVWTSFYSPFWSPWADLSFAPTFRVWRQILVFQLVESVKATVLVVHGISVLNLVRNVSIVLNLVYDQLPAQILNAFWVSALRLAGQRPAMPMDDVWSYSQYEYALLNALDTIVNDGRCSMYLRSAAKSLMALPKCIDLLLI